MICAADFLKINERTTSCLILLKFDITTLFAAFGMIVQNWVYPCWSCNPVLKKNKKNNNNIDAYLGQGDSKKNMLIFQDRKHNSSPIMCQSFKGLWYFSNLMQVKSDDFCGPTWNSA